MYRIPAPSSSQDTSTSPIVYSAALTASRSPLPSFERRTRRRRTKPEMTGPETASPTRPSGMQTRQASQAVYERPRLLEAKSFEPPGFVYPGKNVDHFIHLSNNDPRRNAVASTMTAVPSVFPPAVKIAIPIGSLSAD